ncbi:Uncharacterized protein Adt_39688 [Abeliophyllum distichum]|uniref:Uncharacterized protein n=1 Tax=Abeliophyllum distichum TaxID=126358 RepID=A0ABD1Q5U2_9LAMI
MYVMSYNYTKWIRHGERLGVASSSSTANMFSISSPSDDIDCDNDQDEMLAKADEYLVERANEQLLEDTPLEEIPIDDPNVGLKIMVSVLGVKFGRQIRGLGDGCLRDISISTNMRYMEKDLEEECTTRKVADVARTKTEQRMKSKLNVVRQLYNSTLQSWHHSMQQLCRQVLGFILPSFTSLTIEDDTNEEDDAIGDKENGFDEENNIGEDE